MTRSSCVALLFFVPALLYAQESGFDSEIPTGVDRLLERFHATASSAETIDAAGRAALFTDDAVVINAFGHRVEGRAAVDEFWSRLYATGTFDSSRIERLERRYRQLGPDLVLVDHVERLTGQRGPNSGRELPPRVIRVTLVLRQQSDGEWRIAYYRAGDARELRPGSAAAAVADTLIALSREWMDTWNEKDAERMRQVHSDDLSNVLYGWRAGFGTVEALLEDIREDDFWPSLSWSIEMVEPHVRPLGADHALVSFRLVGEETNKGVTKPYAAAISLIFHRQGREWKIVHVHEGSDRESDSEQRDVDNITSPATRISDNKDGRNRDSR